MRLEMDENEQLMREYEEALTAEREAWVRVQENEGSVEAAADAWNAWLASADKVMKIGLQLSSRCGFPPVQD
jgi:hypothetical protein